MKEIVIPAEVLDVATETIGAFFEPISRVDRKISGRDFLDYSRAEKRVGILQKYCGDLASKKILEVGSGFGTNVAVWIKNFHLDVYGVEPGGEGFDQGYIASRKILSANGIDPERIINATGESLPFPDETFDVVYSANVLEHTANPERVLSESLRVLRAGGVLHMEMPNYLSYFEGHYLVVQPPILFKPMLGWWVRAVFGRDPAYAATLQTQINPVWCRRAIQKLKETYPLELVSLGEELFLERLAQPYTFESGMSATRLATLIRVVQKLNVGNWIGRVIVLLQGHYPIYLTVRKGIA